MPKYIDADALKEAFLIEGKDVYDDAYEFDTKWGASQELIEKVIDSAPAADVAPVKHGHWVYKMRELIRYEDVTGTDPLGGTQTVTVKTHVRGPVPYCSLCDALAADSFLDYCPHCGAKMEV